MTTLARDGATRDLGGSTPQLVGFRRLCEQVAHSSLPSPAALHAWSVAFYREFWRTFLDWSGLVWEGSADTVCTADDVERARFFPGVRLNYAENLLRPLPEAGDDAPALTSLHARGQADRMTRGDLRRATEATAARLVRSGIGTGDRVAVIAPNNAATIVACLALAAMGNASATAAPDMGVTALAGRLEQVEPAALIVDRSAMGGPTGSADEVLARLLERLPTVRRLFVLDKLPLPAAGPMAVTRLRTDATPDSENEEPAFGRWPRLPFDHPLWVMFSSGTTGPPKAMVHGAGGALLEHVKEHRLHGDLRAGDILYFHTTTAWMMWNWQLSALACGAHIVVYDGPVSGPETLWELVAEHGVTVFGTSPAYLQACEDAGYRPSASVELHSVRAVLSTGAVLQDWQFDWLQEAVGPVPLQSISGGTDLVGCFVLGHPEQPVRRGRCQSLSLGLDVAAVDSTGSPVLGVVGELVCRNPFPSRPVRFLNDPEGERFHEAYFADHPGMWTHGDLIEIDRDGSARLHGRSDGVLNIDGIRIGPAEIYRILRDLPEIQDAMAVEQKHRDSSRLVLLLTMRPGAVCDDALRTRIRGRLRTEGSSAHVPRLVVSVRELPLTHNGKRSERAARDAVNGTPPRNLAALRNPECLDEIRAAVEAASSSLPVTASSRDPLFDAVARAFQDVLEAPALDPSANFFDLGGTSRHSMTILRRLRHELRRPVPLDTFLAAPTIDGLSEALRRPVAESGHFPLIRDGDESEPRLYMVHGVYGDVDGYRAVAEQLTTKGAVYGIEGSLLDSSGRPKAVSEIAQGHVTDLVSFQPSGPIRLVGFSFGGLVAFEMARQLQALGRTPDRLVLIDVRPPKASLTRVQTLLRKVSTLVATFSPAFRDHSPGRTIGDRLRRTRLGAERMAMRGGLHVFHDYIWGPYDGAVTYFRARRRVPLVMNLMYAWRRVAPAMTVRDVPGAHHDLLNVEHSPTLASELSAALG